MTIIRSMVPAQVKALGDDEVEVRMSTAIRARDGHILVPQGAKLDNYKLNPVFLWNHNVDELPVGRSETIKIDGNEIVARVKFPPAGISQRADEVRGMAKTGFLNGVSVGFDPIDGDPIERGNPRAGIRFTSWELLECSFCCIPVDTQALVTGRSQRTGKPKGARNMNAITKAQAAATTAQDEHKAGSRHHAAMAEAVDRLDDHRRQFAGHLRAMQRALDAGNQDEARQAHERCTRCMQGVQRELRAIGDSHGDMMDAHTALSRAMRDAWSALGADSGPVKSEGVKDSEPDLDDVDKARSRKRQRDVDILRLRGVALGIE